MSYKLKEGISPRPSIIEMADFWEVQCLKRLDTPVSTLTISKSFGIPEDIQETDEEGIDEFKKESEIEDIISEIQRRKSNCAGKYPFKLDVHQNILSINSDVPEKYFWIYLYLLMATRNNMSHNRMVDHIDGALIFERFCKDVLVNYLGQNASGLVFGTAMPGGFFDKLPILAKMLREGEVQPNFKSLTYIPQDDKLDIAVWIPFEDNQPSKIICFGQCKTGTHWHDYIGQLHTGAFIRKWFSIPPALDPIGSYLIADIVPYTDFYHRSVFNLFFDRCRLMNFIVEEKNIDWFDEMYIWTYGILRKHSLLN